MSSIHLYIRHLEKNVADNLGIKPKRETKDHKKIVKIGCKRCLQTGFIRTKGKRSLVFGPCTECGGSGYRLIEEEE
jgi:hypothetical protein